MNEDLAKHNPFKNDIHDPLVIQEMEKEKSRSWLNEFLQNGNGNIDPATLDKIRSSLTSLPDTEVDLFIDGIHRKYPAIKSSHLLKEVKESRILSQEFKGQIEQDGKPIQTSFVKLSDGSLAEMGYDSNKTPSKYFIHYYPDGKWRKENSLTDKGREFTPYQDKFPDSGCILLPSGVAEYDFKTLTLEIQAFISTYLQVSEFFEKIIVYYILLTWIYDRFTVLPYLRALGDYGSGKSRFLRVIGSLCYKPLFTGGAITPSPIFRILEMYHGTLILDEADFKDSDCHTEIIKILNNGFEKGYPVLRSEGNKTKSFDVKPFDVFGPKIIATRKRFTDKALESRCLTEEMGVCELRQDIPHTLPKEFYAQALELRNKLLLFRFQHYGKSTPDLTIETPGIEHRLKQIAIPLLSVIEDESLKSEFLNFLQNYNRSLVNDRGFELEGTVLEVMEALAGGDDKPDLTVGQVTDRMNQGLPDDKKFTPHRISKIIRDSFQLKTIKRRDGAHIQWDNEKIGLLLRKYGLVNDES